MLNDRPRCALSVVLPLIRVEPGEPEQVAVRSPRAIYVKTHWHQRTYLCPEIDCPMCGQFAIRELAYVVVRCDGPSWQGDALLELPCLAFRRLTQIVSECEVDTWRGLKLTLSRRSRRSPVVLDVDADRAVLGDSMADVQAVCSALSTLYRLPQPMAYGSSEDWQQAITDTARLQATIGMGSGEQMSAANLIV